jgi:predicted amidophosphoribosyltransferase
MAEHKQVASDILTVPHWGICPGCGNHVKHFTNAVCDDCGWELTRLGR